VEEQPADFASRLIYLSWRLKIGLRFIVAIATSSFVLTIPAPLRLV
jgi:hypothetical protein